MKVVTIALNEFTLMKQLIADLEKENAELKKNVDTQVKNKVTQALRDIKENYDFLLEILKERGIEL